MPVRARESRGTMDRPDERTLQEDAAPAQTVADAQTPFDPAETAQSPVSASGRLSVVLLALIATLGAGLLGLMGYVSRRMAAQGSLSFTIRSGGGWNYWLAGLLLAGAVGPACALVATRDDARGLPRITAVIFPAITILTGLLVVAVYHDRRWWLVAPVVVWLAMLIGTIARALLAEPEGFGHDVARTSLTVVTYVIAFIALAMIYINKYRSVYSATAVAIVCFFLLLQM